MTSPQLIVVTVNYCSAGAILNGLDETVRQLAALGNAAFWIIDNQSPDHSAETLRIQIAKRGYESLVHVIDAGSNGGFGAGNNVAIRTAMALETPPDYIYFLNPDAAPTAGAIKTLVAFMDSHPKIGIAGGLLCDETGVIQSSLFRFPSFLSELEGAISLSIVRRLLQNSIVTLETPITPIPVDWVAGTSFIARLSALKTAGVFDETFFLYWEEVELCHRVKKAGFDIYGVPDAIVSHTGGVSTGMHKPENRIPPYWFASRNYFFHVTGRGGNLTLLNAAVACGLMLQRLHQALRHRPLTPPHYLRDFIKYSRTFPTPIASSQKTIS